MSRAQLEAQALLVALEELEQSVILELQEALVRQEQLEVGVRGSTGGLAFRCHRGTGVQGATGGTAFKERLEGQDSLALLVAQVLRELGATGETGEDGATEVQVSKGLLAEQV